MKKLSFLVIIVIAACMLLCVSCDKAEEAQVEADVFLQELLSSFGEINAIHIEGKVTANEEITISADYEKDKKKLSYTIDDATCRYEKTYLFNKVGNNYTVAKSNTTFGKELQNLPFNLANFTYNEDYVLGVRYGENSIVVSFYNKGVMRSFDSSISASGGTFTIYYKDHTVTSTVLNTTATISNKEEAYSARYDYTTGESLPDFVVTPTDTIEYAIYALNRLSAANDGETLHSSSQNHDLGVGIKVFPLSSDKVSRVFCIKTDDYINLNIVYNSPVLIEMVHSSVESVQITYDSLYDVNLIIINDGNRYTLS